MDSVLDFLMTLPSASFSSDRRQIVARCPNCGDNPNNPNAKHFSIKVDLSNGSGLVWQCFRPGCSDPVGFLNTESLQRMGCHDMKAILELAKYNEQNKSYSKSKKIKLKIQRKHTTANPMTQKNINKLDYLSNRLGHVFDTEMLKRFNMQVSLYDYIRINSIRKLAFKKEFCDMLDNYTIGFVSTYKDYIICRDITKKKILKTRYFNYRVMGEIDDNDKKIYTIPFEINDMSPVITLNLAEGIFSVIGANLNTDIGKDDDAIFGAPCGMGYDYFILHFVKQYGFTKIKVNIFSDSEVDLKKYYKVLKAIEKKTHVVSFDVHYNTLKEDFGHKKENILIKTHIIK